MFCTQWQLKYENNTFFYSHSYLAVVGTMKDRMRTSEFVKITWKLIVRLSLMFYKHYSSSGYLSKTGILFPTSTLLGSVYKVLYYKEVSSLVITSTITPLPFFSHLWNMKFTNWNYASVSFIYLSFWDMGAISKEDGSVGYKLLLSNVVLTSVSNSRNTDKHKFCPSRWSRRKSPTWNITNLTC
jgi:hypothetical protein